MLPAIHDSGTGEAVLFLHAFTLDASQWDHQVAALSDGMRCIRPDVWGCGDSPAPPDARAHPRRIRDRGARRARCTDTSTASLSSASRWAVTSLSLSGAWHRNASARWCSATRARVRTPRRRESDRLAMAERVERERSVESIVEPMVARLLSPARAGGGAYRRPGARTHPPMHARGNRIRAARHGGSTRQHRAARDRINVPTLVIAGTQDAIIPTSEVLAIADGIPKARFVELDCGHLSNLELPRAVSDELAILPRPGDNVVVSQLPKDLLDILACPQLPRTARGRAGVTALRRLPAALPRRQRHPGDADQRSGTLRQ